MKYEKYEQKMKKLRKIRNGLFHLRFVFLGLAIGAVATGITLTACTGIVRGDQLMVDDNYTFGDDINVSGDAFLSDVHYQYRLKGTDEWSESQPKNAGTYQYRYYSLNAFGGKKYSEIKEFKINPRKVEFEFDTSTVEYGNLIPIKDIIWNTGHKLKSYSVKYDSFATFNTTAVVDKDSIVVVDENGVDQRENYEYICKPGPISFNKRLIDVHIDGASKEYDGEFLFNDQTPDIDNLAFNDYPVYGDYQQLKYVGTIANTRDIKIRNAQGEDVTHLYHINSTFGNLEVTRRKITVSSVVQSREYNGKAPVQRAELINNTSLAPGHELKLTWTEEYSWKVGEHDSTFECDVIDSSTKKSVKDLYEITPVFGKFQITERHTDIATSGINKMWDGTKVSLPEIYASNLCDGDRIEPTSAFTSTEDITTSEGIDNIVDFRIMRGDVDVTDCYVIDKYSWGNITINRRKIIVDFLAPESKEYDGTPLTVDSSSFHVYSNEENNESFGLAHNHRAYAKNQFSMSLLHAGYMNCKNFEIMICPVDPATGLVDYNTDLSKFYDITYFGRESIVEITQRRIDIETPNMQKTFDGTPIPRGLPNCINGTRLASGDNFIVDPSKDISEVTGPEGVKNTLSFKIENRDRVDVTKDYKIGVIKTGTLNINKKQILVKPMDDTKIYDDREYDKYGAPLEPCWPDDQNYYPNKLKAYGHVYSHTIDVTNDMPGKITLDSNVEYIKIIDSTDNKDVTANFDIITSPETANLNIIQKSISLTLKSKDVVLDNGDTLELSPNDIEMTGAVDGDYIKSARFDNPPDKTYYQNEYISIVDFDIYSKTRGIRVNDNYDYQNTVNGAYFTTFFKSSIHLASTEISKVYSGEEITYQPNYSRIIASGLLPGHTAEVIPGSTYLERPHESLVNVTDTCYYDPYDYENKYTYGKVQNTFEFKILDQNQVDVTAYYQNKSIRTGAIKITPIPITVSAKNTEVFYDNSFHGFSSYNDYPQYEVTKDHNNQIFIANDGLLPNHRLIATKNNNSYINPGIYSIFDGISFQVENELTGYYVPEGNYEILPVAGTGELKIKKIDLFISSGNYTQTYKQGEMAPTFNNEKEFRIVGNILGIHRIELVGQTFYGPCFRQSNSPSQIIFKVYDGGLGDYVVSYDIDKYYNITTSYGYVSIDEEY